MDKNQKVLFMSGFPRAGSTLLSNILLQNNKLFPTPTSGLITTVTQVKNNWLGNDIYKSNGEEYIYPKIKTMLKNMIIGFYQKEVLNGQIPIDKNRGWTGMIDFLDEIFNCKVKIIFPIRKISECVVSMERVNRKSTVNNHGDNGNWLNEQTTLGRAENFLKDDGVMGTHILRLKELGYRNELDRLVFVSYDNLLNYPNQTFELLYNQLELPFYQHDFENIKQNINENDMFHGFAPNSLHKIKEGKLMKKTYKPEFFDQNYLDKIDNERYEDITKIIDSLNFENIIE